MKNWLKRNIYTVCNACLAYTIIYILGKPSHFLFGEPEFPMED